ncbi:MAG: hypothetical protein OEZ58_08035, partial [Gammaproteobacteria bacterium]|nr:hypothetical protein [Gammaproteobacteria bacterium]
ITMLRQFFIVLFIALSLSACGVSKPQKADFLGAAVKGRVVKGLVQNAEIAVYGFKNNAWQETPLVQSTTDFKGRYFMRLPENYSGPILIKVSNKAGASMVCDTAIGCVSDDVDSTAKPFGYFIPLKNDFELSAMAHQVAANEDHTINLSPFSDLVAQQILHTQEFSPEKIVLAHSKLNNLLMQYGLLEIGQDVLLTDPIDVSNEQELLDASSAQLRYSFALAGIERIAQTEYSGDITETLRLLRENYQLSQGELVLSDSQVTDDAVISVSELLGATQAELNSLLLRQHDEGKQAKQLRRTAGNLVNEYEANINSLIEDIQQGVDTTESYADNSLLTSWHSNVTQAQNFIKKIRALGYSASDQLFLIASTVVNDLKAMGQQMDQDFEKLQAQLHDTQLLPESAAIALLSHQLLQDERIQDSYDLAVDEFDLLPAEIRNDISGTVEVCRECAEHNIVIRDGNYRGIQIKLLKLNRHPEIGGGHKVSLWIGNEIAQLVMEGQFAKTSSPMTAITDTDYQRVKMRSLAFSLIPSLPNNNENGSHYFTGRLSLEVDVPTDMQASKTRLHAITLDTAMRETTQGNAVTQGLLQIVNYDQVKPQDSLRAILNDNHYWEMSFVTMLPIPVPGIPDSVYDQKLVANVGEEIVDGVIRSQWYSFVYEDQAMAVQTHNSGNMSSIGAETIIITDQSGAKLQVYDLNAAVGKLIGQIMLHDQLVAEVIQTYSGPVIRYSDGQIESF